MGAFLYIYMPLQPIHASADHSAAEIRHGMNLQQNPCLSGEPWQESGSR
jgi:hypothetical protein